MTEQEGVTKFDLQFTPAPPVEGNVWQTLNGWRTVLHRLGVIGQDARRYGGVGFGNVSMRLDASGRFLVTGTQTGHLPALGAEHYSVVTRCDPAHNRLHAHGPVAPSSESLTHGQLYALDDGIHFVFHVHAPELWSQRSHFALPTTAMHAAYGTPQMVREVQRLFDETDVAQLGIFCMGGHEDGVVSFGASAEQAGQVLLRWLARALAA